MNEVYKVYCKDNDMVSGGSIFASCNVIDYMVVIQTSCNTGCNGNILAELEFADNPYCYNEQAYEHIKLCMAGEC
jgi:hypothetical protein